MEKMITATFLIDKLNFYGNKTNFDHREKINNNL